MCKVSSSYELGKGVFVRGHGRFRRNIKKKYKKTRNLEFVRQSLHVGSHVGVRVRMCERCVHFTSHNKNGTLRVCEKTLGVRFPGVKAWVKKQT